MFLEFEVWSVYICIFLLLHLATERGANSPEANLYCYHQKDRIQVDGFVCYIIVSVRDTCILRT